MEHVYSIQEITGIIKTLFEEHFTSLRIAGEISNCRPSSTGHLYFTLKDEKAALQAVMFKSRAWTLGFEPQDGCKVIVSGALSVYEQRGSYQIIVETMELAGEGAILRMLEERKRKLAQEGLFDQERKRPLPFFPLRIAVITSPTGAALRDIITVLSRRNSAVSITVLPAPVQGAEAAPVLVRQLETANRYKLGDIIIIGRGGGSLEDLLPFSEEAVVRAVAASDIPVISAVGHEIDWALTDFAADVRAPTPSAAAELAVPVLDDITDTIAAAQSHLLHYMSARIQQVRLMTKTFTPDTLEMQFRRIEQPLLMRLDDAKEHLLHNMQTRLTDAKHRLALLSQSIESANPQSILERGYAIVYDRQTGTVLRHAQDVSAGSKLRIKVADGEIYAEAEASI
ncbi:MAG: exodeoxyribonuclease VII large subunit [Treponema sp.]|uniref:exodeoxyribonuclease VII large subunit n=1 Tax=Treponema sp. TaxID=166 RepID=UPI003FA33426